MAIGGRPNDIKEASMNPNQALWEKGDFTQIAASMRESGEALVGSLGVGKGLKALDLGCGDGTVAQILKSATASTPPPPEGFVSPMPWGVEANVVERFAGAGVAANKVSCVKDTYTFNYAGTPTEFLEAFRQYYGPTMNAFEAAEKNGRASDLQKELEDLFNRQNQSSRKDATSIPATFLRVTVAL